MDARRIVIVVLAGVLAAWTATAQTAPDAGDEPAARGETPRPYRDGVDVGPELRAALAASRRDGRVVLVVYGANWCSWCRRLDFAFRHDPVLAPALERGFRVVHADHEANASLVRRHGNPTRLGLPVIVVLDARGGVRHVQETGALELGAGHSRTRLLAFLRRFHE